MPDHSFIATFQDVVLWAALWLFIGLAIGKWHDLVDWFDRQMYGPMFMTVECTVQPRTVKRIEYPFDWQRDGSW